MKCEKCSDDFADTASWTRRLFELMEDLDATPDFVCGRCQFLAMVRLMRDAQREFYRARRGGSELTKHRTLRKAKAAEKAIDTAIKELIRPAGRQAQLF